MRTAALSAQVELSVFIRIALLSSIGLRVVAAQGPLIDYVTYLGGAYTDTAAGLAVDSTGSAYIAGTTSSPDFPVTSTSLGTPSASTGCAFVTKFNPSGTAIDFSVCIANSVATAFALDKSGNIHLAIGYLENAVLKLDPSAQNILYTARIGGPVESMAVDAAGYIYVAGAAGPGLATTPGAYQSQYAGGQCPGANAIATTPCNNAFITKLTPTGSVAWTTYLGGSGPDDAHAIAVDSTGNVWVTGETVSPNFPTTPGALSRTFHGEVDDGPLRFGDAFVAKLDPTGSHLLYSTYLGGSGADGAFGLAVDATDAVYVAGGTQSSNFPTTPGAFKTTYVGNTANQPPDLLGNGFVTKLDTSGNLAYSTFTGVMNGVPTPIAVDNQGRIVGASKVARDITERKWAEKEREQLLAKSEEALRRAEEANRLKEDFLATVSHELRNPLTSILGWVTLLEQGRLDPEKTVRAVTAIKKSAQA